MKPKKLTYLSFLILSVSFLLAACGQATTTPEATVEVQTDSGSEEPTTASVALDEWQGNALIQDMPEYQDYINLLLKRSKVKKDKDVEESPREKKEKKEKEEKEKTEATELESQELTEALLMAHYMPWFQTPYISGYWGIHWTMNTCDPNVVDASGRREICSHHYPLIGPYDTSDPDLHEYHALLMHLSGIDGVIIDWYGIQDHFDWPIIRQATEDFINALDKYDLKYVIMYEDKTIEAALYFGLIQDGIATAALDLQYLESNFFSRENYLHINNQPLLLNFGPSHFETASEWQNIFSTLLNQPNYKGLWAVDGLSDEFYSWVYNDEQFLAWFYQTSANENWGLTIGEAYPMFDDYYFEGGWGDNLFEIDDQNGELFMQTLQQAADQGSDIIQLNTWNDFGEGTDIEPSVENGYQYLVDLQSFTQVAFDQDDLEAATDFYFLRKELAEEGLSINTEAISNALKLGNAEQARSLMQNLK